MTLTPTTAPQGRTPRPALLMAHYMPWYQTPSGHGYWGYHWTMNHFDPDKEDSEGRREIASHYYPLTGPYDSSDGALLEYQVLLMKLSGIDGVIVDWYGIEDFWDYGTLNESTHALFDTVKKAGLLFSICYEDQTIKHMVDNDHLATKDVYTHGQAVMQYLHDTWFTDDAYLTLDGRPALFIFGPQYFKSGSDWTKLFAGLDPRPFFITLDNLASTAADASYPWPPMSASINGVLSRQALESYLTKFYDTAQTREYLVGSAFPGFHDIYKEAGVGEGYGYLDAEGGDTFAFTLDLALSHDPDVVQLVTWNDYGEGTIIEPTVEFGYKYLEMVQDAKRTATDPGFPYTPEDLALPLRLYKLREQHKGDAEANARLDGVFDTIVRGELDAAVAILDEFPVTP